MNATAQASGLFQRVLKGFAAGVARSFENPPAAPGGMPQNAWTEADLAILDRVEGDLASGRVLLSWWESACARENFEYKFELQRSANPANRAYGFFDTVGTASGPLPIIGTMQEMRFDQPKHTRADPPWLLGQLREFVLRYFMRVSTFSGPDAWAQSSRSGDSNNFLSWCPKDPDTRHGFGFSQLYYKKQDETVGAFPLAQQFEIVDLLTLRDVYRWIVAKVQIYDFSFAFQPLPAPVPQLVVQLNESSYLILAHDFIRDVIRPEPGVAAEFGLGYAYLKNAKPGTLAYGPGEFDAAFQLIRFRLLDDGSIQVRMVFVANRPKGVLNIPLDPLALAVRAASALSLSSVSEVLSRVQRQITALTGPAPTLDPVYGYVSLMNVLTGGYAARQWCISREQLSIEFLVKHFEEHYNALAGALYTWRQVPDWLDATRLPAWVITGQGSPR